MKWSVQLVKPYLYVHYGNQFMSMATYSNDGTAGKKHSTEFNYIQSQSHNHIDCATPAKLPWSLHLAEQ